MVPSTLYSPGNSIFQFPLIYELPWPLLRAAGMTINIMIVKGSFEVKNAKDDSAKDEGHSGGEAMITITWIIVFQVFQKTITQKMPHQK